MEIILLEKIRNLGGIGEVARVKGGYARNYLIPYGKALFANEANLIKIKDLKAELEQKAQVALEAAQARADQITKLNNVILKVKATEDGKLFGAISTHMIVDALAARGVEVKRSEIVLPQGAIRQVGEFTVQLLLHTDLVAPLTLKVEPLS